MLQAKLQIEGTQTIELVCAGKLIMFASNARYNLVAGEICLLYYHYKRVIATGAFACLQIKD